jgi:hypothetical protein
MEVKIVVLACAGDCATVEAIATGGHAPYTFAWEDGSTNATRQICPAANASYTVKVTDTATTGEFAQPAETVQVPLAANVLACSEAGTGSDAGHVVVPATGDLWLAGQPNGASLSCPCGGMDTAPANSPTEVPVVAGETLTFSVTGSASYTGGICFAPSPDGGCTVIAGNEGPANGLSSLNAPLDALIGVFLDDSVPSGTPPTSLDASGANAFTSLAPQLRQAFFIGDGLTGTGTGAVQQFVVPAGATRLFLASSDDSGGNQNNAGQFDVSVTAR